ncbi:MAG: antibiotic biosynthesis monooxygenase [Treponema sp.]|nr:antibiotic biosynthesis monooxygenase [Treponema sp.]
MILLNVMYTLKSGCKDEFLELLKKNNIIEDTRQEPGNIRYEFFLPIEDNHDILLVEMWQDENAFEEHLKSPHFEKFSQIKKQYIRDINIEKFTK